MSAAVPVTSEAVQLANAATAATPTPVELARALGEENFRGDEHGQFEVAAVDKYGAPDPKKAHLLREMFSDRTRLEKKLTTLAPATPEPERRVARGTISVSAPAGGWPVFDRGGRVIG